MAVFARKEGFALAQSLERSKAISIGVETEAPATATAVGIPVVAGEELPEHVDLDWDLLGDAGFDGKVGQTYVVLSRSAPAMVLVGVGDPADLDTNKLRDAAAALARAAASHSELAVALRAEVPGVPSDLAAQAIVEGVLMARYRYDSLKTTPSTVPLNTLTMVAAPERFESIAAGVARGRVTAEATNLSRDLANTPPALLTAEKMGDVAVALGAERGFGVELFDEEALIALGCGGLLGVNAGSEKEPRMIKLTYEPRDADGDPVEATGRVTFVGKGIMYDSGGLAIKPGDAVHATMKNDMSGAGSVLAAVAALPALECTTAVTGYLMCTDNVPSGTAMAMGDVLTVRGGTTVEVLNTDAEGRLVMADALVLATEDPPDAIVDIATLTGACLRTFGTEIAGVMGNHAGIVGQLLTAAETTDEPLWELPLAHRYRRELDSQVADISNMGGPNAGSITAALFLEEFVAGLPWAHIDIAGTAQNDQDASWRPAGCTGFGARLLIDFAMNFEAPDQKEAGR